MVKPLCERMPQTATEPGSEMISSPLSLIGYERLSELLLNGFQAASFRISAADFRAVLSLLGEELDDLPSPARQAEVTPDRLAELEKKYHKHNATSQREYEANSLII